MDDSTRIQYLSAMGVDVWVPRATENTSELVEPLQDTWDALQTDINACQQCELCQTRQQPVCGSGNQQAEFLWLTDAPNLQEEQQGAAFTDQTAELFDEILRAVGLNRSAIFSTHIVKCRPVEDKEPKVAELQACDMFLQREIAMVQPKRIFAVGRIAAQQLLRTKVSVSELRQATHEYQGIPVSVLYHPAYLLRKLSEKASMWNDLQRALADSKS